MATVQEIAKWVIESFDSTATTTVEHICEDVLRRHGAKPFAAATEASEKAQRVLTLLRAKNPEELPFEFSESKSDRLIGKQRIRVGDTPETIGAREVFPLTHDMLAAVYACGNSTFEKLCAAIMLLSGAQEAFASCASDDGGIDVYGRIPLRLNDEHVKTGILNTAILQRSLFFLGQCKCYEPAKTIGPGEIHEFYGSVEACRSQYDHNPKPPSHRVPETYYRRGEISISIFFTTGTFTDKAVAAATADGIIPIEGTQIAQFLTHHRIAVIRQRDGTLTVDGTVLDTWASGTISNLSTSIR